MEYTNAVHGAKMLTKGRGVFGSDWRLFNASTLTAKDIMNTENSPALRNTSLVIRSVGIEHGTHTKFNKFWTSSFQASHWTVSFANRGSSKVSQGSSSPLGIGYRYRLLHDHYPGLWNRISQWYAELCHMHTCWLRSCEHLMFLVLAREKSACSHTPRAVYLGKCQPVLTQTTPAGVGGVIIIVS